MPKVPIREFLQEEGFASKAIPFFKKEFDVDLIAEFEDLKQIAALPVENFRDRGALFLALNEAALNAWRANRIYLKAKREFDLFKIEALGAMRPLRRAAIIRINEWAAENSSKKQITEAMILEEIAADPVDGVVYRELQIRDEDLSEIRDNLKSLSEMWKNRIDTLRSQASLIKDQTNIVFGKGDTNA